MEKSHHLKESYDSKNFHYVTNTVDPDNSQAGHCACPCDKYIAQYGKSARGRCPVCGHYRVPQPVVIVQNALEQYNKKCNPKENETDANKQRTHTKNNEKENIQKVKALLTSLCRNSKSTTRE